jgi:hypothetical protein
MNIDLSRAYTSWPNTEPVTVTLRRAGGSVESIAVANALRRAVASSDRSFGSVRVTGRTTVWNIPDAHMNGREIDIGDSITDAAGTAWQVLSVQHLSLGSRWRCLCEKRRG